MRVCYKFVFLSFPGFPNRLFPIVMNSQADRQPQLFVFDMAADDKFALSHLVVYLPENRVMIAV